MGKEHFITGQASYLYCVITVFITVLYSFSSVKFYNCLYSLDDYIKDAVTKPKAAASKPLSEDTEEDLRLRCSDAFIIRECERRFKKRINPRDGSVATIGVGR